jgi:hypothetical protein
MRKREKVSKGATKRKKPYALLCVESIEAHRGKRACAQEKPDGNKPGTPNVASKLADEWR